MCSSSIVSFSLSLRGKPIMFPSSSLQVNHHIVILHKAIYCFEKLSDLYINLAVQEKGSIATVGSLKLERLNWIPRSWLGFIIPRVYKAPSGNGGQGHKQVLVSLGLTVVRIGLLCGSCVRCLAEIWKGDEHYSVFCFCIPCTIPSFPK